MKTEKEFSDKLEMKEEMANQCGMEEECMDQAKFKLLNGGSSCETDPKAEVRYKRRDGCTDFMSY